MLIGVPLGSVRLSASALAKRQGISFQASLYSLLSVLTLLWVSVRAFNMPSHHHCFCNFCKGSAQLSRFKIKQHEKFYGLWDPKEGINGPSAAKQSRISSEDFSSDSSESDNEQEAHFAMKDTLVEEDFDDCPSNYHSDGTDMVPKLSSVRDSPASPEVMQQTNLLSLLK